MSRVINFLRIIQNNWKKTLLGVAGCSYGISYGTGIYEIQQIMRKTSEEALMYGNQLLPSNSKPENVLVILNPVAKTKKAKNLFKKYCEPLLHLAGFAVTVVQTQSENEARNLIANLNIPSDIIVVAGGDGTLSDVVTGLMRRYNQNCSKIKRIPIGILPLGNTNSVANSLFNGHENVKEIMKLLDATMTIIRQKTKLANVIKVQLLEEYNQSSEQSIYAIGNIEWGAWKDAYSMKDQYWYFGSLKRYASYVFGGLNTDINFNFNGTIRYTDPCNGCSNCVDQNKNNSSLSNHWWKVFVPKFNFYQEHPKADFSRIINKNCGKVHELPVSTTELHLCTGHVEILKDLTPSIKVELGPQFVNFTDFVVEGWKRINGNKTLVDKILWVKSIDVFPEKALTIKKKDTLYIDNEEFEFKPVKLKLLPGAIKIFCPEKLMKNDVREC